MESDTIKQVETKEKIEKEYLRKTKRLHEIKLYSRNLTKGINTWAVFLVIYSGPFLNWTREELQQTNQGTKWAMYKALHPRDNIDRLYVKKSRRKRRRTLQHRT